MSCVQPPVSRQRGRRSKADLLRSATCVATEELLLQCAANDPCEHHCLTQYLQASPHLVQPTQREFAAAIADWRDQLATSESRSGALLEHLNNSWTQRAADGVLAAKSTRMRCFIPRTECSCCLSCWALAADAAYLEDDGKIRRGSMFCSVLAAFNRGETGPENVYSTRGANSGEAARADTDHFTHEGAIKCWLDLWLPGNVDQASVTAGALVLDAPSRRYVYDLMAKEWSFMGRHVPHISTFNKTLRKHYKIVINKHKKFAQCQVCALYKELWAKSRMETFALREEIKIMRREHLHKQYSQRMCYYCAREQSYNQPGKYLCIIIDAMTESSTSTPMQAREVKGFKPAAYRTQMYGAQVHGPEGFFAYTTCSMKGARVTVEVLHRTLMKLAESRKEWPSVFTLQLDNTTSDCKNHTVLAYLAWLVAIGVFEVARVAFLMVGHTHEDIDGMFGLLRRYLWRLDRSVMTIEELHEHIRKCFHKDYNKWMKDDTGETEPEFDMFDKHFDIESMCSAVPVEHLWSTHDWTAFLLQENHPDKRAFREIANIAQTQDPDVYRPHLFDFAIVGNTVVLNVKHWADDTRYWNEDPMPVWNRIPDLKDLKPASVMLTKTLEDLHRRVCSCNEWFALTGLRCKQKPPHGACPRCTTGACKCEKCARCAQLEVVQQYVELQAAMSATENDLLLWGVHFDNLTQKYADAMLPKAMELPTCERISTTLPSIQEQIDNLPRMMKAAPVGLKCKLEVLGVGPKGFRNLMAAVDVSVAPGLNGAVAADASINLVVGACRSSQGAQGALVFAVLQNDGIGKWVTFRQLRDYEDKRQQQCGEMPRAHWFGADVSFQSVLVQEGSKRVYAATLKKYVFDSERWVLDFPAQEDNAVFGTSACTAETQIVDLEELNYRVIAGAKPPPPDLLQASRLKRGARKTLPPSRRRAPRSQIPTKPAAPLVAPCYVHIEPLPAAVADHLQPSDACHRFWVSRSHFGLPFIQKKLRPLMLHVGGVPIDPELLQRCVPVALCGIHLRC